MLTPHLTDDIWLHIINILTKSICDVVRLSATCKSLYLLSSRNQIWFKCYKHTYPRLNQCLQYLGQSQQQAINWKGKLRASRILERSWRGRIYPKNAYSTLIDINYIKRFILHLLNNQNIGIKMTR